MLILKLFFNLIIQDIAEIAKFFDGQSLPSSLPIQILRRQTRGYLYDSSDQKLATNIRLIAIFSLKALLLIIIIFRPLFLKSA